MPSVRQVQWAKIRITVVAIAAIAVLTVLVYLMSGGTWMKPKTSLTTYIADSTGLEADADVLLNGVKIGKVDWVQLSHLKDPGRAVEARLIIESEFLPHIPEDSVTGIDSANLLGDEYLNITMGKSPRHVQPGGVLRYRPATNFLQNIDLRQFDAQLRIIDQTIQDIQNGKGPLGQFVVSDQLYTDVLAGIRKIEKSLAAVADTNSQMGQILYSAQTYNDLRTSLRQVDDKLAQMQANPYLRDTAQYDQIREQIGKLHATLTDLTAGKGAGGKLLTDDADYIAWSRLLARLIESVDDFNYGEGSLSLAHAQMYESLNGSMRELAATMKDFREHPQKYLRLKVF
jgi:ABC-type transporter Mla subunit MlaD